MRDTQPPITNPEEYYGYQKARDTLTELIREREARLIAALGEGDERLIEDRRAELLKVYRNRQGIIDAIKAYERTHQQSA
jgi:hypothetical protein